MPAGLKANCWSAFLHNTRLGMAHPMRARATRSAFTSYFSLCPSNAGARLYLVTLIADISHSYRPDLIELETPGFMGFVHGSDPRRTGLGWG